MRLHRSRIVIFILAIFINFFIIWHVKCPETVPQKTHHKKVHYKDDDVEKAPLTKDDDVQFKQKKSEKSVVNNGHKLAIIVPFRDRFDELLEFAPDMDHFLTVAGVDHEIIVVNQADTYRFNRAALINAGFLFTVESGFDYLAMHDVDLIPTTHEIKYEFPAEGPVHLASPELHPKYHYANYVGGILMLTHAHFRQCRGMSNNFWGWGREDDEFFLRMREQQLTLSRPKGVSTGYDTFKHVHDKERRPRDYKRIGNQKKEQFKRDPVGGFDTLKHEVARVDKIKIGETAVTILNVLLECDERVTPWCKNA